MVNSESKVELIFIDPDANPVISCSSKEAAFIKKTIEGLLCDGPNQTFQVLCINPSQASWIKDATKELAEKMGPDRFRIEVVDPSRRESADVCFLSIGSSGLTGVSDFELRPELIETALSCSKQKTYILASPHFIEQAVSARNPYKKSRELWFNLNRST